MAQERYLSPREILSYLCDLERKMPQRDFREYTPLHSPYFQINPDTPIEEVDKECQKMLVCWLERIYCGSPVLQT